jgi:hypothetical protein
MWRTSVRATYIEEVNPWLRTAHGEAAVEELSEVALKL